MRTSSGMVSRAGVKLSMPLTPFSISLSAISCAAAAGTVRMATSMSLSRSGMSLLWYIGTSFMYVPAFCLLWSNAMAIFVLLDPMKL